MELTWPNGARLALSVVVNIEEGSEMTVADGDKGPEPVDELGVALKAPIRNFGNESNYRYGIKEGAPRVLKLLDKHNIRTTVTAAALALERAPEMTRQFAAQGHEFAAHGYRWIHQFSYDEARERDFIRRAAQSIEATTGARPKGWLSRYLLTPRTRRLLIEEGYTYHMDDYSADAPFWESVDMEDGTHKPLVVVPYALDTNDMKFWLDPSYRPQDWLDYAIATLDWLHDEGADRAVMMSIGLHLRIIGRPGRIGALDQFLAYAAQKPNTWIATRGEIAERFAGTVSPPA
ncbi:MAG: polysaccharide deacetylase family protein [Devosia sp.]